MTRAIAEPIAAEIAAKYGLDETVKNSFLTLMEFVIDNPESVSKPRGKKTRPDAGTKEFYVDLAEAYFQARARVLAPSPPSTIPDPMVSYVLEVYFGHAADATERIKVEHQHSMAAENLIGALLEKYVGTTLEKHGWAWCAGDFVSAVDIIQRRQNGWMALQIKNRSNTENSSSSAIRDGTTIEKWFRTFSHKPETNWPAFPDDEAKKVLSEEGFRRFVKEHLEHVKAASSGKKS